MKIETNNIGEFFYYLVLLNPTGASQMDWSNWEPDP